MYNNVVIIDDNKFDCSIIEAILRKYVFATRVTCIYRAEDALAYLHSLGNSPSEFPDLILLDIQMPAMDGFGFLDGYLELPEYLRSYCFVVMISSTLRIEDTERMQKYPVVQRFLYKPFSEWMLAELRDLSDNHVVQK